MKNLINSVPVEGATPETQMSNNGAEKAPKRATKRNVSPLWSVITKANRVFAVQVDKNNERKLKCLKNAMVGKYSDHDKFWVEYHQQTSALLDSRRFCKDCMDKGLYPVAIAEHVVFEGSAMMRKVLKEGVTNALGEKIQFYKDMFTPEDKKGYITEAKDSLVASIANLATTSTADTSKSADTKEKAPEQAPKAEEQETSEQTSTAA